MQSLVVCHSYLLQTEITDIRDRKPCQKAITEYQIRWLDDQLLWNVQPAVLVTDFPLIFSEGEPNPS